MEEIDVWRSAQQLMKQYGADAAIIAAMRADALLEGGDTEGFRTWQRIAAAINELEKRPSASEPVN